MNEDALAELRRLRARAYGPAPDIHGDPAALRRLEELEARNRQVASVPADEAPVSDAPPSEPEPGPALEEHAEPAEPSRGFRRWMPWLWLASLVTVGVLAAAWTFATAIVWFAPLQRDAAIAQVAVLTVDEAFDAPAVFGSPVADRVGFQDFDGLTAMTAEGGVMGAGADDTCLVVVPTASIDTEADIYNGPIFVGCSAGAFPATVELLVTHDQPEGIRDRFPAGTALQFVLDGERVVVFSDAG
ncbi:hypothetical protein ACH3VR_12590 [Microbacterium sp. B2969]|uniref:Uncharacterized protein n=1 Tax=Microbacterium alkaliflavum TaxID=3248839 RepID=A0ABW7Q8J8_9MICO